MVRSTADEWGPQVVRVKAPWVKCYYNVNGDTYIIPNIDTVVLGGTSTLSCAACGSRPRCMLSAVTSPSLGHPFTSPPSLLVS